MKQTAVEWLAEKLRIEFGFAFSNNILEQAKAMEKQQQGYSEEEVKTIAKDAYIMGRNNILIGVFNKWFKQFKNK